MQRVLILGVTGLFLLGIGLPRFRGMHERLERLEERNASLPVRERTMRREVEAVRAELAAVERELRDARALSADERAAWEEERAGLERRLRAFDDRVADLDEQAGEVSATTEIRLAALESEVELEWDGLRSAVDAAASLASETKHELEGLVEPSERERWRAMVGPSVQLSGEATVGSGVLLPPRELAGDAGHETLVLTAWHVVRDIRADSLEVDPLVPITIYGEDGALRHERARLIVREPELDVALLRLTTDEPVSCGVTLATADEVREARIFRAIVAVGCPLGNDPIPTRGEVADTAHRVDGSTYWMINAPTYIGNSGGAVFDARTHRVMGVFSKIYTHGSLRPTVVPHMGLVTPLDRVYAWLEDVDSVEVLEGPDGIELRLTGSEGR